MKKSFLIAILLLLSCQIFCQDAETNESKAPALTVIWPDDFENPDDLVGQTLQFNQEFVVTSNYYWVRYGELVLSTKRLITPTEITTPGSNEYKALVASNNKDMLMIKGYGSLPWADADGTFRTGATISNLRGTFTKSRDLYYLNVSSNPTINYAHRPTQHDDIGDYNLKVCSFNLHIYLASDYGTGYGPETTEEAEIQHNKLVAALANIDADIYGVCEVQTGQDALAKLANALNTRFPDRRYSYINDGDKKNGSFTKVGFIYRADKVAPLRNIQSSDNSGAANRKKAQGFELLSNGEKFVYFMGHYKAKSGTGTGLDANQGDGQGIFNYTRTQEATATATFVKSCATYFKDPDVLITGDLNAYSQEDPLRILYNNGFTEMIRYFNGDNSYSYSYNSQVGLLDHALANESLKGQVTGATVYHINTDEPTIFSYDGYATQNDIYYSSDHDPVIVGLKLEGNGTINATNNAVKNSSLVYYGGEWIGIAGAENAVMMIYSATGQLIGRDFVNSNDFTFNKSKHHLADGVYIIKLRLENGSEESHKIIIR